MALHLQAALGHRFDLSERTSCTAAGSNQRARKQSTRAVCVAVAAPALCSREMSEKKGSIASQVDFLLLVGKLKVGTSLCARCSCQSLFGPARVLQTRVWEVSGRM